MLESITANNSVTVVPVCYQIPTQNILGVTFSVTVESIVSHQRRLLKTPAVKVAEYVKKAVC
jgi:hypothetical protein